MNKIGKAVVVIAVIALILGALCILTGFVTSGDPQRVKDILFATYDVEAKLEALRALITK